MAASPAASSSSAPTAAAAAAAAAEATDGPVLSVVSKRLRALRKKYNRITQMEESLATGKTLNREQEEVLRSKPVLAAQIEELERLRAPLASALAEELSSRPAPAPAPAPAASSEDSDSSVQDLISLVYFGSLFDVKLQHDFVATMVARTHERNCCITYDYVTDDAADMLVEADLDAVSALASLAASRPAAAAGVSHRDALEACAHHARLWLRRSDEPIYPDSTITYAGVRAKLEKIMSLDYYTTQTEIRATEDLAASVGSYGTGGVQAQESTVVSPQAPEAVEESLAVEGHKDEKEKSQATEIYTDHQAPAVDAQNVDDDALVNPTDEVPSAEAERFDAGVDDQEQKDQQFVQRRSYQNQRGGGHGGRRGYPNGRGGRGGRGGGYQNGRGGGGGGGYQNGRGGGGGYYYEPGYYQPRNYSNNRGRGGRSGGGNSYYNNGGGAQGGGNGRVELGANA